MSVISRSSIKTVEWIKTVFDPEAFLNLSCTRWFKKIRVPQKQGYYPQILFTEFHTLATARRPSQVGCQPSLTDYRRQLTTL